MPYMFSLNIRLVLEKLEKLVCVQVLKVGWNLISVSNREYGY